MSLVRTFSHLCVGLLVSALAVWVIGVFRPSVRRFSAQPPIDKMTVPEAATKKKLRVPEEHLRQVGKVLRDPKRPLKERFRALFTLKNLQGGVPYISEAFNDKSALLLHELAYCLGQTQEPEAIPILIRVLENSQMQAIARHEAAEALAAIGSQEALAVLQKYESDADPVIAETCQLALERLRFIKTAEYAELQKELKAVPYTSVDPAPPFPKDSKSTEELRDILLDAKQSIWNRYRAMFTLRNLGTPEAIRALGEALPCPSSALFRHEVAFVFGQMQQEGSVPYLRKCLEDTREIGMVRHECAEALGSIATDECTALLKKFISDPEDVVRESCEVALDMCEYENSAEFQYADTLAKLAKVHNKCRGGKYPGSEVGRADVPTDMVDWAVEFADYQPIEYEAPSIADKDWADPKIGDAEFKPKFNELDGKVNRKSHEGEYAVVDGRPRNPHGRTGITGRGRLGRFGPNHAADPVVTRWKRDSTGKQVIDKTTLMPVAEFVAIERRDSGQWAIPGGMVDPGEQVSATLRREFMEEAMDSETGRISSERQKAVGTFFDQKGVEIYKGYVDDPRNTDNAWMETVVVNFHDERGDIVGDWPLRAGSDAGKVRWLAIDQDLSLYADHAKFIEQVAVKLKAHW